MILLRKKTEGGGDWWVATHTLRLLPAQPQSLIPVRVLTLLSQLLVSSPARIRTFRFSLSLECKLQSVGLQLLSVTRALADANRRLGDTPENSPIRDYEPENSVVSSLDAYLNSIYSVLEVAARLNHEFDRSLPQRFTDQSKRYGPFAIDASEWLRRFFDLRREIAHFSSPLLVLRQGTLLLDFANPRSLLIYPRGATEIPVAHLMGFLPGLHAVLDDWARDRLAGVDRSLVIEVEELVPDGSTLRTLALPFGELIERWGIIL